MVSPPALSPNPDPNLMPSLLAFLSSTRASLPTLRRAHALLLVAGLTTRKRVARHLVLLAAGAGALDHAVLLHSRLPSPDPVSSNAVLKLIVRQAEPSNAVAFYCRNSNPAGCRPSTCTFPILIVTAKLSGNVHQGKVPLQVSKELARSNKGSYSTKIMRNESYFAPPLFLKGRVISCQVSFIIQEIASHQQNLQSSSYSFLLLLCNHVCYLSFQCK